MPRRTRGYRRRHSTAKVYASIFAALVVLTILVELAVHAVRTDPRDSRAIAERELQLNTLQPGEHVLRMVSVFKRPAINYFRATRGLLVLTNRRLLYLGLEPRDLLAAPDLPPTFEEHDFPIDTLVQLTAGRTWFGIAKAVVVHTPTETLRLGVPSEAWPSATGLISTMGVRHQRAVASSAEQHAFLAKVDAERRAVEAARHKPKYYVVRRGDALGSIATIWNTTPDQLRTWNHLPNNRIRIGDSLVVRPVL
jgi:LysM domain-containing protein